MKNSNQSDTKENTSSTKEQDFYLLSSHSKNLNHFILENKDKNKKIIFLNNASSMSNLIHIYDNHCDVFIKNESLLDIKKNRKKENIILNLKDLIQGIFLRKTSFRCKRK
ncbi:hypothetical protein ACNF7N_09395 [Campylobacter coli]